MRYNLKTDQERAVQNETLILCPVCSFNNTHVTDVEARHDHESTVTLGFACENGHEFRVRFYFHEGETFIYCEA